MIHDMIAIVQDYWLLLLIGQYPNGPLGGLANTLILSALSIALAFPVSILFALARLSGRRCCAGRSRRSSISPGACRS